MDTGSQKSRHNIIENQLVADFCWPTLRVTH